MIPHASRIRPGELENSEDDTAHMLATDLDPDLCMVINTWGSLMTIQRKVILAVLSQKGLR